MKLNLMKSFTRLSLAAAMSLAAASLHAETLPLRVTVPFAFTVGNETMPAGEYSIEMVNGSAALKVSSLGGSSAMALTVAGSGSASAPELVFSVTERGRALSMVRWQDGSVALTGAAAMKPLAKGAAVPGVMAAVLKK